MKNETTEEKDYENEIVEWQRTAERIRAREKINKFLLNCCNCLAISCFFISSCFNAFEFMHEKFEEM